MTGLFDIYGGPAADILPRGAVTAPPSFGDLWSASRQAADALDRSDTRDLYAKRLGANVVEALRGRGVTAIETGYGRRIAITPGNLTRPRQAVAERIWREVAKVRETDPDFLADLPDQAAFEAAIIDARTRDLEEAESVLAAGGGVTGALAGFGGAMQSTAGDRVTWITTGLTLPIGGPIAGGVARRIGLSALREAVLNAAATTPALVLKARNAAELGREYGLAEAAADLGMAAAVGGILGAGAEGAGVGIERLSARQIARELRELPEKTNVPLTREQEDAARVLERQADDLDASPYASDPIADGVHLSRLDDATDALLNDEPLIFSPVDDGFDPVPHMDVGRAYVAGGGSLRPDVMGEAMGLEPGQALRVLQRLAASPGSGLYMSRAGELRRIPQRQGPVDAITFIADRGGLRNDEGHDLANVGALGQLFIPRAGPMLRRRGGLAIDEAGELLAEAGYFGRAADVANRTEAEVLELLEQASVRYSAGERLFAPDEQLDGDTIRAARRAEGAGDDPDGSRARLVADLRDIFSTEGIELADGELDNVIRMWREGDSTRDIVEDYVMSEHWLARTDAAGPSRLDDDFDDVPWPDDMEVGDGIYPETEGRLSGGRDEAAGADGPDAGSAAEAGSIGRPAAQDRGEGSGATSLTPDPETGSLGLDLGAATDPAADARIARLGQMQADSPLRPGDRAAQADVDGLPMFDAERSPDMFAADAASGRAFSEFDDPDGAGAAVQAERLLHDLRAALDDEAGDLARLTDADEASVRQLLDELDADEAALKAVRDCL